MPCFFRQRTVKGKIIRFGKQRILIYEFYTVIYGLSAYVSNHTHTECFSDFRHSFTDGTKTKDRKCLAVKLACRERKIRKGFRICPITIRYGCRVIVRTAREMQNQSERVLRNGMRRISGDVADRDAAAVSRFNVNIIVTRRKKSDKTQFFAFFHNFIRNFCFIHNHRIAVSDRVGNPFRR